MNSSLNHVYRLVWNAALNLWQVASEATRGRGKTGSSQQARKARRALAAASALALASPAAWAVLPTGGNVVAGSATISQAGNALNINQGSDKAAIDWQSFNIGQGNSVNFVQPSSSSVALNRVLGSDVSVIQGAINANGQVFLVNQNGVLFTPTAQVNVGGIVASTQNISTDDFLAGTYKFSGNSAKSVENKGSIKAAQGGTVALIAAKIINSGSIEAQQGTVGLAAGKTVIIDLGGPVKIQVTEGALNTLIEQSGGIKADGGNIYLTAKAAGELASSVINHTGVTQARTLAANQKGQIILLADMAVGTTKVAGTLDASAPTQGDGGFIETSAAHVKVADGVSITTNSAQGQTGTWLIDPKNYTVGADDDITGAALSAQLANTNVIIQSTLGFDNGDGDININEAVTWNSNKSLTLSAQRNININENITSQNPTGKLALEIGQGSTTGTDSDYYIAAGKKVNLQAGQNFSLKKGFNGTTDVYTVITALGTQNDSLGIVLPVFSLQGLNFSSPVGDNNLGSKAVLGADIDASTTSTWVGGAGFTPIGSSTPFTGQFHGLGHTISGLVINRPGASNVGLFGTTKGSVIRDVGLINASVIGNQAVGTLVGSTTETAIKNVYASGGSIKAAGSLIGGLIGIAEFSQISNAYSSAQVTSSGGTVGGLVGGSNSSSFTNVYATGAVSGSSIVGGLIGSLDGTITIANAYATGDVSAPFGVIGGLVGFINHANVTISNAYTTGKLTLAADSGNVGGLVGYLGESRLTVNKVYSTSEIVGGKSGTKGALLGGVHSLGKASIADSFWRNDGLNSPTLKAVGTDAFEVDLQGVFGKTLAELKQKSTFLDAVWDIAGGGGALPTLNMGAGTTIWQIGPNNTPIYISLACGMLCNNTYGNNVSLTFGAFDMVANGAAVADAALTGTATYSVMKAGQSAGTSLTNMTDAGTYTITYTGGLTSGNATYAITPGSAVTWTVVPRPITVTADAGQGKIYGNVDPTLTYTIGGSGLVFNDTLSGSLSRASGENVGIYNLNIGSLKASINYDLTLASGSTMAIKPRPITITANDGQGKVYGNVDPTLTYTVGGSGLAFADTLMGSLSRAAGENVGNYELRQGTLTAGNNYDLTFTTGKMLAITPRSVSISGITASNKVYDGNRDATLNTGSVVFDGLIGGDVLAVATATGQFNSKDVATANKVAITDLSLGGTAASNYMLTSTTADTKASITQQALTISGTTVADKIYNGNTSAVVTVGSLSGLIGEETLGTTTAIGTFASKNAQDNQSVTVAYTLADKGQILASNYSLANEVKTASITKKALTIAGSTVTSRQYDGSKSASVTAGTLSGLVEGETLGTTTAVGAFDTKDAGTNKDVAVTYELANGAPMIVNTTSLIEKPQDSINICVLGCLIGSGTSGMPSGPSSSMPSGPSAPSALASNYTLAGETLKGSITQRQITVSGITAAGKTYNGNTNASITKAGALANLVSGELLGVTTSGVFTSKNAGQRTVNTTTTLANGEGGLASNYTLTNATGSVSAVISKKDLTISGITAENKTYNGKQDAVVNSVGLVRDGLIANDELTVTTTGLFSDKHAANGKTVSLSSTYGGADVENYNITSQATTTANIAQKALSISGISAANKTYDGTRTATVNTANVVRSGLVTGDILTVTTTGLFADKNAANGKTVALTSTYGGTDVGNYSITGQGSTLANITKREITVAPATAASKAYDGLTAAQVTAGALKGLVAGESLVASATGYFTSADVGNNKVVNTKTTIANGTNGLISNYTLTNAAGTTTANITKANAAAATIGAQANALLINSKPLVAPKPVVAPKVVVVEPKVAAR